MKEDGYGTSKKDWIWTATNQDDLQKLKHGIQEAVWLEPRSLTKRLGAEMSCEEDAVVKVSYEEGRMVTLAKCTDLTNNFRSAYVAVTHDSMRNPMKKAANRYERKVREDMGNDGSGVSADKADPAGRVEAPQEVPHMPPPQPDVPRCTVQLHEPTGQLGFLHQLQY